MLRTREYFNRFFIKSAFIKMLKKRFDEEGIVIPFPITALNVAQEGAASVLSSAQCTKDNKAEQKGIAST
jgi:small-conductance mechanosensitive channel